MIDLSTCVPGQKVKYRNGDTGVYAGIFDGEGPYKFMTRTRYNNLPRHAQSGSITIRGCHHPYDVVEILPVETPAEPPTVDLSTCTPGQKVKYRNGNTGTFLGLDGKVYDTYPFLTEANGWDTYSHARSGTASDWRYGCPCPHDIVEILPVETPAEQPMIDLSTCVPGQKVRFQNGQIGFVTTSRRRSGNTEMRSVGCNLNWAWYTLDGIQGKDLPDPEWRIVEILPVETPEEPPMPEPTPTPQEMDYKAAYIEIANIISVAFPECEVTTVDMARLLMNENRTLRMALGLPSYKQVSDAIYEEEME
jgi:hypothetical protein